MKQKRYRDDSLCINFLLLRSLIKGTKAAEKKCKICFEPKTDTLEKGEFFLFFNIDIKEKLSLAPPLSSLFPNQSLCDLLVIYKNKETPLKVCFIELKRTPDENEIKTQIEATYRLFKEKKLLSFSCECEYNCFYRSKTGAPKNKKGGKKGNRKPDTFVFLEGREIPLRSLYSEDLVYVLREKI
jgi:hypothetical protein